jgi:predicted rRNA methylase YqxC with S4 and FtsJ domains
MGKLWGQKTNLAVFLENQEAVRKQESDAKQSALINAQNRMSLGSSAMNKYIKSEEDFNAMLEADASAGVAQGTSTGGYTKYSDYQNAYKTKK